MQMSVSYYRPPHSDGKDASNPGGLATDGGDGSKAARMRGHHALRLEQLWEIVR
jgi:hypothetical protein